MFVRSRFLWLGACLLGLGGVASLAVAAHAMREAADAARLQQVGMLWLAHAPVLLLLAGMPGKWIGRCGALLLAGLLLFALGVAYHAFTGTAFPLRVAPLGGMLTMLAWLGLMFAAQRN